MDRRRCFRVSVGNTGSEITIGKVTKEFLEYWENKDYEDLVEFLFDGYGAVDNTLPKLDEEWDDKQWYDVADIEHVFGCSTDSTVTLTEVSIDSKIDLPNSPSLKINPVEVFGREAYHHNTLQYQEYVNRLGNIKDWVPVLIVKTWEKGCTESWFIETDETGVDPKKIATSILETNLGEVIENIWYDRKKIERNLEVESTRKGVDVEVGWMNLKWHDQQSKYTDEYIDNEGCWDEL